MNRIAHLDCTPASVAPVNRIAGLDSIAAVPGESIRDRRLREIAQAVADGSYDVDGLLELAIGKMAAEEDIFGE